MDKLLSQLEKSIPNNEAKCEIPDFHLHSKLNLKNSDLARWWQSCCISSQLAPIKPNSGFGHSSKIRDFVHGSFSRYRPSPSATDSVSLSLPTIPKLNFKKCVLVLFFKKNTVFIFDILRMETFPNNVD
ncbi:hypothetical protein JTE90_009434 [Oedothorax gibbosus]|uniref:Uncharacterized protein n=1 Tax=Oedothorax gibbosus TaxID=931172 RepID=A0AAV6VSD6_9ARAC|nr:hypothetical protein JTE90_009434 [Oedothorax gibbosus]